MHGEGIDSEDTRYFLLLRQTYD